MRIQNFFALRSRPPTILNNSVISRAFSIKNKDYFFKQLKLNSNEIQWPKRAEYDEKKVDYWHENPHSIQGMYSLSNLAQLPVFKGSREGYINFGCWPKLDDIDITCLDRTKASQLMYQKIAEEAKIDSDSRVVDVGCGTGFGCMYIMERYHPSYMAGLDITPQQIHRSKVYHKKALSSYTQGEMNFINADALAMPFKDSSLTHVISVEAAQHFSSLKQFIQESQRVLKPSGVLTFTTFFPTNSEGRAAIQCLLPDSHIHSSDKTVDDVMTLLVESMQKSQVRSIGKEVWPGLEKWLQQIGYRNQWTMLWPKLYKAGLVDYFIFRAEAPELGFEKNKNPENDRSKNFRM